MSKSRYVRLKDLAKLAEKYPNAVLAYPVDQNKYEYSNQLAGEFYEDFVEMHQAYVGRGGRKIRHIVVIK